MFSIRLIYGDGSTRMVTHGQLCGGNIVSSRGEKTLKTIQASLNLLNHLRTNLNVLLSRKDLGRGVTRHLFMNDFLLRTFLLSRFECSSYGLLF